MPAKGTKKRNPQTIARSSVFLPNDLYNEIERLAAIHGILNPRNGQGNRTKLIELAVMAFKLFCRYYHTDSMPYPENLCRYLHQKVVEGDQEAQEHLSYLESWSSVQQMQELMTEGIVKVGEDYIV